MFKRRDWNYLYGDGLKPRGESNNSSSSSDDDIDGSMESIGGMVDLDASSESESEETNAAGRMMHSDDEKDDKDESEEVKEETKKEKLKRKSSSFVALKCTVCEKHGLVLSEKAKREHERSKRHKKRVSSLPEEDERKKESIYFVPASSKRKFGEREEETETHLERLARIRLKRKRREEEEEREEEERKRRKEANENGNADEEDEEDEKEAQNKTKKKTKEKVGRRQMQSIRRQKAGKRIKDTSNSGDGGENKAPLSDSGKEKTTTTKKKKKTEIKGKDDGNSKEEERAKVVANRKGKPGKRERLEMKAKREEMAKKAREAGERGVKKALQASRTKEKQTSAKDRRRSIIAKAKKKLGME